MKKFFTIFFVTLGVIFFIIILLGIYLFVADPLNLKPLFFGSNETTSAVTTSGTSVDKNPALSDSQEKALETFGVDPAALPSSITPAQESCFIDAIGATRVNEIKAGDSPTAVEFFQAKDCI